MRYPVKTVCALVSIIGLAAIVALHFRHPSPEEADNRTLLEPVVPWNDAVILGQELEDQAKCAHQRCVAKDALALEVIAGRLTLFEAAAKFRTINKSNPQAEHWLSRYQYRDEPYELALCRSVIRRVELELEARALGAEDNTVDRLEAELAEHLRRHGRVSLPD